MAQQQVIFCAPLKAPYGYTCFQCKDLKTFPFTTKGTEIPKTVLNCLGGKHVFCSDLCIKKWFRTKKLDKTISKLKSAKKNLEDKITKLEGFKKDYDGDDDEEKDVDEEMFVPDFVTPVETTAYPTQKPMELKFLIDASLDDDDTEEEEQKPRVPLQPFPQPQAQAFPQVQPQVQTVPQRPSKEIMLNCLVRELGVNSGFANRAIPILKEKFNEKQSLYSYFLQLPPVDFINLQKTAQLLVSWASSTDYEPLEILYNTILEFQGIPTKDPNLEKFSTLTFDEQATLVAELKQHFVNIRNFNQLYNIPQPGLTDFPQLLLNFCNNQNMLSVVLQHVDNIMIRRYRR